MSYNFQEGLMDKVERELESRGKIVLAAAPGSGKTRMAIKLADRFGSKNPKARILILTHGQILLREQWAGFFNTIKHKLDFEVVRSSKEFKVARKQVVIGLPQSIIGAIDDVTHKFDLIIVDEAHQRYLAEQVQGIVYRFKPKYQLLLTGTPALYVRRKGWKILGYTLQELLKEGVITDPIIEIAESEYAYDLDNFDSKSFNLSSRTTMSDKETFKTLDKLLSHITDRLLSPDREDPVKYDWPKKPKDWKETLTAFHKTMIVCNSQAHAMSVHKYFGKLGIKNEISISDISEGSIELDNFMKDSKVPLLIVVNRGVLGFNYNDLMNVIDLSGSLNVNRIFQLMCRVVRKSDKFPTQKKLFIKLTSKKMASLTYFVMSYVVALSDPQFYYSFKVSNKSRVGMGGGDVPVNPNYTENMRDRKGEFAKQVPDLPRLLTFNDLAKQKNDPTRSIAYTDIDTVLKKVYGMKRMWTIEKALAAAMLCRSRKDFELTFPGAYSHLAASKNTHRLDAVFGTNTNWTLDDAILEARKYKFISEFKKKSGGAFNFLKRAKFDLRKLFRSSSHVDDKVIVSLNDHLVHKIIKDPNYQITRDGQIKTLITVAGTRSVKGVWRDCVHMGEGVRNKRSCVRYGGTSLIVSRIMYLKFKGKLHPNFAVGHIDGDRNNNKPENLKLMTMLDINRKQHHNGKNAGNSKINLKIANEIRDKSSKGKSYRTLIKEYKLSKSTISYIVSGKIWKDEKIA